MTLHRAGLLTRLAVTAAAVLVVGTIRPEWGRAVLCRSVARLAHQRGLHVTTTGADRLETGRQYVLVANHSSPLDIPALLIARPRAHFVMAADLVPRPLRPVVGRAFGVVFVERRRRLRAARSLTGIRPPEGADLVVFPEGGIAPSGERLKFKTGAFALAVAASAPVAPVAIHHSSARLPPRGRLATTPGPLVVEFLEPLWPARGGAAGRRLLRDQAYDAILAALREASGS